MEQFMARFPEHVNMVKVDDEHTALHIAANNDHLDIVRLLASMVRTSPLKHSTLVAVLHWLCNLSVTTGHLLPSPLQTTCNLNAKNNLKQLTPLRLAVEREHSRILEVLVGYGADLNMACSDGHTPLHVVTTNKDMKKPTPQTQQLQRVRI